MWVTIGSGEGSGLSVRVEGERFLIGSGDECQLMVRGERVEPLHAYFEVHDDGRVVRLTREAVIAAGVALAMAAAVLVLVLSGGEGGGELSVAALVRGAKPETVLIQAEAQGRGQGGSGWVLDARRGLVVTNFHVVNGGERFVVGVGDQPRQAELVAAAPCDDLAMLRVDDPSGLRPFPLGSQGDVSQGDPVLALGYPANASLEDKLTSTT